MAEITLLHNPQCSTSRHAEEELAQDAGGEVQVINYLKTPLTREELLDLLGKLEDPPADLVRKDAFFTAQRLDERDYTTADDVADLLAQHPRLMQRPVLIRGDRAIIGRPKERVAEFLAS